MSKEHSTHSWKPSVEQYNLLFAELGRCVYLYQSIEFQLKTILPHLVVPGSDLHAPDESFDNWRVLLDSKMTLGALVSLLSSRVNDDKAVLENALRRLVDERNEVIHHFASQPFAGLKSEQEFVLALDFLKTRRKSALPVGQMMQECTKAFLFVLQDAGFAG